MRKKTSKLKLQSELQLPERFAKLWISEFIFWEHFSFFSFFLPYFYFLFPRLGLNFHPVSVVSPSSPQRERGCRVGPEMKSLFPLAVCCISLVSLQQLLALPVEERPNRNRSDLLDKLIAQTEHEPSASGNHIAVPSPAPSRSPKRLPAFLRRQPASGATRKASPSLAWARPAEAVPSSAPNRSLKRLPAFLRRQPASGATRKSSPSLVWARPAEASERRVARARRHAHSGSRGGHHYNNHHAQLMRVGCVLGTCQVQNLSHRLYQLIGQSGREDSSPINPRSPHSFG